MEHSSVLTQIAANIREIGHQERQVIALEQFEVYISPAQLDHMSFATPLPGVPADWATAVAEMQAVFAQHGKRPRLEYIADLHPTLAEALEQAGLVCESRAPVMALEMDQLAAAPPLTGQYQRLTADNEALLCAALINQSIAYGGSGGDDALDWLPSFQQGLRKGQLIGAVLVQDDELVSGAVIQMGGGIGELAGVWSAAQWRNRGLAFALCQRLLAEYGALDYGRCWLSAAEGAQRLYEKLGFVYVGTQLNYGRSHSA